MRTFYAGNGSDSTAAVLTYLSTHRLLRPADLFVITTAPNYSGNYMGRTFLLTSYSSPLQWVRGTFLPAVISRSQVASKIGLDADTVTVTWSPQDSDVLAVDGGGHTLLTVLAGFGSGVFDNGTAEIWRCLMPTAGDANTLGACLMFAGRIGNIKPDRLKAEISVISRLEVFNEKVPTNLIEPTNILAQYTTGQILINGPSSFALIAGSTSKVLYADPTDAPGGYTPMNGSWNDGYIVMTAPSQLGGTYRSIRLQTYESGHHVFYLYGDLPFTPSIGDTMKAFIEVPRDQAGAVAQGSDFLGFPYVPSPIDSSVVIG